MSDLISAYPPMHLYTRSNNELISYSLPSMESFNTYNVLNPPAIEDQNTIQTLCLVLDILSLKYADRNAFYSFKIIVKINGKGYIGRKYTRGKPRNTIKFVEVEAGDYTPGIQGKVLRSSYENPPCWIMQVGDLSIQEDINWIQSYLHTQMNTAHIISRADYVNTGGKNTCTYEEIKTVHRQVYYRWVIRTRFHSTEYNPLQIEHQLTNNSFDNEIVSNH